MSIVVPLVNAIDNFARLARVGDLDANREAKHNPRNGAIAAYHETSGRLAV